MQMTFQTPPEVVEYMCSMIPVGTFTVLEPTPGQGNIVWAVNEMGLDVTAPDNFFDLQQKNFDCVIMNPPFSSKYAFGVPESINEKGMKIGYHILFECMKMSDNVIALMPWFLILDSSVRLKKLQDFGLKSITALPRSTFEYARIQCCIFELDRKWKGKTEFKIFHFTKRRKRDLKQTEIDFIT